MVNIIKLAKEKIAHAFHQDETVPTTLTQKIDGLPVANQDAIAKRTTELIAAEEKRQRDIGHK